jgi:hypothetical protein
MPARAAAELSSAGPRDQDHYKGYRTRYFSASWGLCEHTNDVESTLIHYAISFSAPVAQLDRVPGYEPGGREFESLRARQIIQIVSHMPVLLSDIPARYSIGRDAR